jgi:hypothetical protein
MMSVESKQFSFEKKNQKTFAPGVCANWAQFSRVPVAKVFASFSKKKRFLASLPGAV